MMQFLRASPIAAVLWASAAAAQVQNSFYATPGGLTSGQCANPMVACTIQYATQVAATTDGGGNQHTIFLASGYYAECVNVGRPPPNSRWFGGPYIMYVGQGGQNTFWNGCSGQQGQEGTLIANAGADVGVQDLTMQGNGFPNQSVLYAQNGGHIEVFAGVQFTNINNCIFFTENAGSFIMIWKPYTVYGNITLGCHAAATSNSFVEWAPNAGPITLYATQNYTTAFFYATYGGGLYNANNAFNVDHVIGVKWLALSNGWILSGVGGCQNLPGSQNGTTSPNSSCD